MQTPLQVTFQNLDRSEAVEVVVRRCLTQLEHLHFQLTHCHVWIDLAQHHALAQRFRVRLAIGVAGSEITISDESGHPLVFVAIADAFVAARRQLEDHFRIWPDGVTARAS